MCFVLANCACLPICAISRSGKQTQIGAKLCRNWIESYRNYRRQWRCHMRGASVSVSNSHSNSTLTLFPPLSLHRGLPKRLTSWGYCNSSRLCKKDHRCLFQSSCCCLCCFSYYWVCNLRSQGEHTQCEQTIKMQQAAAQTRRKILSFCRSVSIHTFIVAISTGGSQLNHNASTM